MRFSNWLRAALTAGPATRSTPARSSISWVLRSSPRHPWAYTCFMVAVALQVVRAKIEERKFLRTVPEYAAFREITGFLWPRLRKTV